MRELALPQRRTRGRTAAEPGAIGFFEFWPGWLFYAPIVAYWIALGLRHGSQSLPTAANPHIETGGLCGESKSAILDQVQGPAREWVAPYVALLPGTADEAEATMAGAGLAYPVVAKPDIGCNGTGVRLLRDRAALATYLDEFPRGPRLVLQRFVEWEGEAGLFYIRHPHQSRGRITSVTLKSAPVVVGDGVRSLRELILSHPRAGLVPHFYLPRFANRLDEILPRGTRQRLVFVGNHCKGAVFEDGRSEVTRALSDRMEELARSLPDFHFGRIDLRYRSLEALRQGRDFAVIEINGVGSEPTHIWDPRCSLLEAWRAQFEHYGAAFRIGAALRKAGARPSGLGAMAQAWRLQRRLMASYPAND